MKKQLISFQFFQFKGIILSCSFIRFPLLKDLILGSVFASVVSFCLINFMVPKKHQVGSKVRRRSLLAA